jgi:16S rRNA processing protein RimM
MTTSERARQAATEEAWVRVGQFGRPHGVRGELRLWLDNPGSTLLQRDPPLRARLSTGALAPLALTGLRPGGESLIARVAGVDDREAAARLCNVALEVPRSALPALEPGEFYHIDVIGAEVRDADGGALLGHVRGLTTTSVDVLIIATLAGDEVLVPILADVVPSIGEEPGVVRVRALEQWR